MVVSVAASAQADGFPGAMDRDRYRHAVSSQTPASQMIEPESLPIGDSNDIVYCNYDDEFSLFIDQMINDPSA